MKILMVSWEYPPVIVGGLGRHVYQLATALAADGHEVVVLSRQPFSTDPASHPTTDQTRNQLAAPAGAQQLNWLQPGQCDDNKNEQATSQQQKRNHETGGRRRALKPSSAHDSGF